MTVNIVAVPPDAQFIVTVPLFEVVVESSQVLNQPVCVVPLTSTLSINN